MSEVYRRLAEPQPSGLQGTLPFPADARRAAEWIEALPRTDVAATRRSLLKALEALATLSTLKGGTRREIAEVLRPIVVDVALSTQRTYAGKPLPLAGDLAGLPGELSQLHLRLAHAYRLAAADLCAPSGSLPWLRGARVTAALQIASHHYVEAMRVAWRVYAGLPPGAWRGLHRCYRFAIARELERRPSTDTLVSDAATLQQRQLQVLLMSVLKPRGYAQSEQDKLWTLCGAFVPHAPLRDSPTATSVGVPDDADEGPGGKAPPRQWLDLVSFAAAVESAIAASNGEKGIVVPDDGPPQEFPTDTLRKLRRALSSAAARQFIRLDAGHAVDTVFGLSGVHYLVSGERDFDRFARDLLVDRPAAPERAAWSAGSGDSSAKVAMASATVFDQSLGGYRIRWGLDGATRLRVGEIVGLRLVDEDDDEWMLGILRWLRYDPDGHVLAGVELISRAVAPVVLASTSAGRAPWRALELRPTYGGDDWLYLASQRLPQGEALAVARESDPAADLLDQRPSGRLADLRLLQVLGDYFLYRHAPGPTAHS
ncbi:MAG: hypothetical protein ACK52N_13685 [Lysobacteraceae bacterium]